MYVAVTDYKKTFIVAVDPETGDRVVVDSPSGVLVKDAAGHVLTNRRCWGGEVWLELTGRKAVSIDAAAVQLTKTSLAQNEMSGREVTTSLAFSDGGYIRKIVGTRVTYVDPDGSSHEFAVKRDESPLRIFSVGSGGGKIWCGTFIPLTLFSYDSQTGESTFYDNPTETTGEIYNSAWSKGKLFMASYTAATLTRFSPDKPWKTDHSPSANPAHLGKMKEDDLPLHRPHGKALAPDGTVFFAAHGSYGCDDSGICRIDPETEEIVRWIYPDTFFDALCHIPDGDRLLVSERRKGDTGIRFTFVSAETGKILSSEIVIADGGDVVSWLPDGGDLIYGLHAMRAMVFAYSLSTRKIVKKLEEIDMGDHCYNALVFGPDNRIWGLTNKCVYAVDRELTSVERLCDYEDHAGGNFYRFGMAHGLDGYIYFPNGSHLMRVKLSPLDRY